MSKTLIKLQNDDHTKDQLKFLNGLLQKGN